MHEYFSAVADEFSRMNKSDRDFLGFIFAIHIMIFGWLAWGAVQWLSEWVKSKFSRK